MRTDLDAKSLGDGSWARRMDKGGMVHAVPALPAVGLPQRRASAFSPDLDMVIRVECVWRVG